MIIKNIKRSTAAYYEIAFSIPSQLGDNFTLAVKCSRKDVQVHTLIHSERNKPYQKMDPLQKKIFALDVATSGSWSRMTAQVMNANFKQLKQEKDECVLAVELPEEMKNHSLDIFLLYIDPKSEAADINFETREVKGDLELKISPRKNKKRLFVIIEPVTSWCLYNSL